MAKKSDSNQIVINIDSGTVFRILGLVVVTLLALKFVQNIAHSLVLIFISFFLALALNPAVSRISRMLRLKSRVLATGVAYIAVLTVLSLFIAFVVPPLVGQTVDFIKEVPKAIEDYSREDSAANRFVDKYNLEKQVDQFASDFGSRFGDIGSGVVSTAGKVGSTVANTIVVLVLTFMMLVEGPVWLRRFWSVQPVGKRKHRQEIALKMYRVVTNYVNGQVFIAALGGFFATIAIFILSQIFDASVNAVALGGIIALFALLPLIGTILGAVIVVLACLLVSLPLAIAVAIYFIVYQQLENVTIQPYVQSRGNNLTPLTVFVAAIIGVGFGGFLGALVAIPTVGCIKILVEDYFARRSDLTKDST
jgi:predicted PurR-regulated permease PerM